jgi:hypothetical protein
MFPNLPFLRFFCQTVEIPSVSTNGVEVVTPFISTYRHGVQMKFEELTVNAIIDEEMKVWEETYNWIRALTRPTDFAEYVKNITKNGKVYHDAILTINTNANIPNLRIIFKDCHPIALGSVRFNTAENADTILTADITFRYDYFELERL